MIDFVEMYYYNLNDGLNDDQDSFNAKKRALGTVIPHIVENELTKQQRNCFNAKYLQNKTQQEIAESLHLSQPTVSRHINTARDTVNNILKYCYLAATKAISVYADNE